MKPLLRRTLIGAIILAGLWVCTAMFGPRAASTQLGPALREAALAQGGPPVTDVSLLAPDTSKATKYWVRSRAVAPMILLVRDGLVCGNLCESDWTSLYLWYPGGVKLLLVLRIGAS